MFSRVAPVRTGPPVESGRALRGHVPVLDGIRGVAILLVMLCHFTIYGPLRPDHTIERVYRAVTIAGWSGVDLFFVLSGFLITGILVDAKNSRYFFRHFYIRRFLRIFPLYYGMLAMFFVVLPLVVTTSPAYQLVVQEQRWYWSYLTNFRIAHAGWPEYVSLGHFWSLAVEEQFYMIWPFVVWVSTRRGLIRLCSAAIVGALLVRLVLVWTGRDLAAYMLAPARMDALAIGGLLAIVARGPNGLAPWRRTACWAAVASGGALTAALFSRGLLTPGDPVVCTIGFSVIAIFFGSLLTLAMTCARGGLVERALSASPLTLLGQYSYALYVFHEPLIGMLSRQGITTGYFQGLLGSHVAGFAAYVAVAGGTSVTLAAISWRFYERPILSLKDKFPYVPAAPATAMGEMHRTALPVTTSELGTATSIRAGGATVP